MSTTASLEKLVADRIDAGLEPCIRRWGAGFQVRVRPFGNRTAPAALAALELRDELYTRRDAGERTTPRATAGPGYTPTLAQACDAWLTTVEARVAAGDVRPRAHTAALENTRVWRTPVAADPNGGPPFCELRLDELDAAAVTRYLLRVRRLEAPVACRFDLQDLKKVLAQASLDGARFDASLRLIDPPRRPRRDGKRRACTAGELELLASCAPEYGRRAILLAGTTGLRLGELFTLADDRLDLDAGTLFVPAELCKEGRDKTVPLLPAEVRLLREQLLARPAGTRLVFVKRSGAPWLKRSHFYRLVWNPAKDRAAAAWRDEHGLHADAPTPFDVLRGPHDLRRTAATLMRQAGLPVELAAARLGHGDGGALLLAVYRKEAERDELAAGLLGLGDSLLEAARRAPTGPPQHGTAGASSDEDAGASPPTPIEPAGLRVPARLEPGKRAGRGR